MKCVRIPGGAFDCLRLVKDQVLPFYPVEILDVRDDELVTGDDHVERGIFGMNIFVSPELTQYPTLLFLKIRQYCGICM